MKNKKPRVYDSLRAAAKGIPMPMAVLKAAKEAGCPAFRSNRVHVTELLRWIASHPEVISNSDEDPKTRKLLEEIRKLRLMNDAKEGRLIERAAVAQAIQSVAGDINALRIKSEAEHSTRFAETHGDQAQCRIILKKIWDEIFASIQSLERRLPE